MTETRQTIIDETRGTDFTPLAHYTSEPYDTFDGDEPIKTTCTVDVSIRGTEELGYILHTRDEADGPTDDLGETVYATFEEAVEAMGNLVLARPDGWLES
jgi:hypothetical protein